MKKRTFLKLTGMAGLGLAVAPFFGCGTEGQEAANQGELASDSQAVEGGHVQSPLTYGLDALEPAIDAATMGLHYGKHHAGYVKKLNAALANDVARRDLPLEAMLSTLGPEDAALRNNGGGHYNHELYWKVMQPGGASTPQGMLAQAITERFGSFKNFQEEFVSAGAKRFGSGWVWLIFDAQGMLQITSTPNQDNPLMARIVDTPGSPLLGMDVWEHAYYLNYQNKRGDYMSAFMTLVNWDIVGERFASHFA